MYSSSQKGRTGQHRLDGTLLAMQSSKGKFQATQDHRSPASIMKRSASGGLRRDTSGEISMRKAMEPISEQYPQENFQEQMTQHSNFEESLRDPTKSREQSYIMGLTEFLKEEFYKRVGFYTESEQHLVDFWKNYVSELHRDQKLKAIRKKHENPSYDKLMDFDMDYNIGLGWGQNDTIDSYAQKEERMGFRSTKSPKQPIAGPFYPAPAKSHKPPAYRERSKSAKKMQSMTTPDLRRPSAKTFVANRLIAQDVHKYLGYEPTKQTKESIEDQYRRYSQCYEYDVWLTVNSDIQKLQKDNKIAQLDIENREVMDRETKIRFKHRKKMAQMLTSYYNYKIEKELEEHYNEAVKQTKMRAEEEHSVNLRSFNVQATVESKNIKGSAIASAAATNPVKTAAKKDKERQKQIKKQQKAAEKAAKEANKAKMRKTMGKDYESISSDEDEDDSEDAQSYSDDDDVDVSESKGSKSRSRKGSRLDESAGKVSLSRSRDDREDRKRSSSKKKVKKFKWEDPVRPAELAHCNFKGLEFDKFRKKVGAVQQRWEHHKRNIKEIMFMVREIVWDKTKPYDDNVGKLTNDMTEISRIYDQNHTSYFADGQVPQNNGLIKEFFSDKELGVRFRLYKDEINKSRRRGDGTFHTLFDNISYEDRVLYLINQDKEKTHYTKVDEKTKEVYIGKVVKIEVPYLRLLEKELSRLAKKETDKKEEKLLEKEKKAHDTLQRKVFGRKWSTQHQSLKFGYESDAGAKTIVRPDYTKPKNKWKVATRLDELRKDYDHDRVIERMYTQEIATNQPFKAPQEYDIFDVEIEKKLKGNFGFKKGGANPNDGKKQLLWKEPNFNGDEVKMQNFRDKDMHTWDQEVKKQKAEYKDQEKLEKWIQKQAFAYQGVMVARKEAKESGKAMSALVVKEYKDENGRTVKKMVKESTEDTAMTLRAVLAKNYWDLINAFGDTAYERFPHSAALQGQDPKKSKSFQNSYPAKYKNYFFKLVKNIIKKGKSYKFQNQPASLVNCVGARESTLQDPIGVVTHNTKLQSFKVGSHLKKYRTKAKNVFPAGWRTRALKRKDDAAVNEKLKDIFMMQSEIDNCTFEPNIARNDPDTFYKNQDKYEGYNEPEKPGRYFEQFGTNFINNQDTKSLYKYGKLKKARIQFLQGEYDRSLSTLQDGFDLARLFQHYRPSDYLAWKDYKIWEKDKDKPKKKKTPPKSNYYGSSTQQRAGSRSTSPIGYKVADKWELEQNAVDNLVKVFKAHEKKDAKTLKFDDLDICMRELGMMPKKTIMDDFIADVRTRTRKEYCDFKNFSDFMAKHMVEQMTDRDLRDAFALLDKDGSGAIDADEFRDVMNSIDTEFNKKDIEEMVRMADKDGNGEIDFQEFKSVMKSKKGKDANEKQKILRDMKEELTRYLKIRSVKAKYKQLSRHYRESLEKLTNKKAELVQNDKEKANVLVEELDSSKQKGMYDQVWELYENILKRELDLERTKRRQQKNQKDLVRQRKIVVDGDPQDDLDDGKSGDEEQNVIDYKKLYKTIMCPLRKDCTKVKMLRWPSTSLKANRQFGKDCPYAHHPMELLFPETLDIRISANKTIQNKKTSGRKEEWKFGGSLFDCTKAFSGGCGAKCNLCDYKAAAKKMIDHFSQPIKTKHVKNDDVLDRQEEINKRDGLFARKFGILKKASVLYFYDRPNDAFNTVRKAAEIMKEQHEVRKEKEAKIQRKWQEKLGLPEGLELPDGVTYEKVMPEDVTDDFLRKIDGGTGDLASLKLYIMKVCPKVRSQYDKNTFLDGLIEDLYLNCWDKLTAKMKGIDGIHKKVEEYGNIWEQMEAYGSDQDQDQMDFVDAEGNPIKLKKQKKQMCENVQKRKLYKDEGIEMKADKKYYVDTKFQRQNFQDPVSKRMKSVVCHNGKDCKFAHTPIELDLNQLPQKIKNLGNVIKVQDKDLRMDKPMEAWKPSAKSFKVSDLPLYVKPKKKKEGEEDEDKKPKREGILQRENPWRKPYDKD